MKCAQIYDSACVIKQELEWVRRWNRGREYGTPIENKK
jgi:hypothetical protein